MNASEEKAIVDIVAQRVDAVERAAVDVLKRYKKALDDEHEARKPSVTVNPVFEIKQDPPTVNIAPLPVDCIVKALKELTDAALTVPVPMVQSPDVPLEVTLRPVVNVDLSPLEAALDGLAAELAQANEERRAVADALARLAASTDALVAAVKNKSARAMRVETDESGNLTIIEV